MRTLYGSQTIERQLLSVLSRSNQYNKAFILALRILRIFAEGCASFSQRVSRNEEDMDFLINLFFVIILFLLSPFRFLFLGSRRGFVERLDRHHGSSCYYRRYLCQA